MPTRVAAAMAKAISITRRGPNRSVPGPATSDSGPPTRKKTAVSNPSWERLRSNSVDQVGSQHAERVAGEGARPHRQGEHHAECEAAGSRHRDMVQD